MVSARGRGRFNSDSQDKGGRGGNHIPKKGSDTNTAYNNINTIVVHQNDTTAQSKGNNGQPPNTNGKPDNVSTSLQQTGAEGNAAG